jgi:hypothetical protein
MIGLLNWMVTLGRFDIMYATNTLARFSIDISSELAGFWDIYKSTQTDDC